jgi:hypothetical protein
MNPSPRSALGTFIENVLSNRRRTYWRGLLAGILAHVITLVILFLAFFVFKPFVWFSFSSAPYPAPNEPLNPDSIEWLVLQGMNFITWFVAGLTIGRWSSPKSHTAVATLVACIAVLSLIAPVPHTQSPFRVAIWFLASPLAIIIGNFLYWRREERASCFLIRSRSPAKCRPTHSSHP